VNYLFIIKVQVNLSLYRHPGDMVEKRYSSYSFLTLALDGSEWSALSPGSPLPPGKGPRYPLDKKVGRLQGWYGYRCLRINTFPLSGIEPRSSSLNETLTILTVLPQPHLGEKNVSN
jgi:hypothetical protein